MPKAQKKKTTTNDKRPSYALHSGVLYRVAMDALYRTIQRSTNDREPVLGDALVAIMFSAATLEALISEMQIVAKLSSINFAKAAKMAAVGEVLEEAEENNAQLHLKYLLVSALLAGKTFDKGAAPFQDFSLLIKLRNAIVHMKPTELDGKLPGFFKSLQSRKLAAVDKPGVKRNWVEAISTTAAAHWACETAAIMTASLRTLASPPEDTPLGQSAFAPMILGLGITFPPSLPELRRKPMASE